MGLHIFYSDRIEGLAHHLKKRIVKERAEKGDPFVFSRIAVPNRNIERWLQIRVFADTPSLCAGIRFPFINDFLSTLLLQSLKGTIKDFRRIEKKDCATGIFNILQESRDPDLFIFRRYINGSGGKLEALTLQEAHKGWQLSNRLAELVDTYELRRDDLVEKWLGEELIEDERESEAVQRAEAALIRHLFGEKGLFPPTGNQLSLRQLFERAKGSDPAPPQKKETLYLFGISTLTTLHARILQWLSRDNEVVFYHNSVCREFWGDIQRKDVYEGEYENPLLSEWGIAGKESMNHLVSIEEVQEIEWEEVEMETPPPERTLLERVQAGIRERRNPGDGELSQDYSLQIFGAPGIRREVETVYEAIIGAVRSLEKGESRPWEQNHEGVCSLSDIAILVPDMATYRPLIEAVFDGRGEIPYGLIDSTASEESLFLRGLLDLFKLWREGFTRERLFTLLSNICVQKALDFGPEELSRWKGWVDEYGAFEGFNREDLIARGGTEDSRYFTWEWALKRLRLGTVAESLVLEEGNAPITLAPCSGREAMLKFSAVVEKLYRGLKCHLPSRVLPCAIPNGERWQETWYYHIAALMENFLSVGKDEKLESEVRRQILKVITSLQSLKEPQPLESVAEAIGQFVGGLPCRKGGYLTHGVTIAGLLPLRPVPFKQVFILGLGEDSFPGRKDDSTLDLRGLGREIADTALPEMNRYLFLETLMATRQRLVLSYPDRDICRDAELFPCSVIRTLENFLNSWVKGGFREARIPLLESDPRCTGTVSWQGGDDPLSGLLPTYSRTARQIAIGKRCPPAPPSPTMPSPLPDEEEREGFTPKIAAEFIKDPFRAVMNRKLGIPIEGYQEELLEEMAPLGMPQGPVLWEFQKDLVLGNRTVEELFSHLRIEGRSPEGFLGEFAFENFRRQIGELEEVRGFAREFKPDLFKKLVFGKFDKKKKDTSPPPPEPVLPSLCEMLFELAKTGGEGRELEVAVINFGEKIVYDRWRWSSTPEEARTYLSTLESAYREFLRSPLADRRYLSLRYRDLIEKIGGKEVGSLDWGEIFKKLQHGDSEWEPGKKGFNNDLTIDKLLKERSRPPESEEELREYVMRFYTLPLSGKRVHQGG